MPKPKPGSSAPELAVDTLGHGGFSLSERDPERFTMIVFYRGLHCPVCKGYIAELDGLVEEFSERGVEVVAVSGDSAERAARSRDEWGLDHLTVGHGLSPEAMRAWGLFVSSAIKDDEPDLFNEPSVFLIDRKGKVFLAILNSAPFGRPKLAELRDAVDFVVENDFPPRGVA